MAAQGQNVNFGDKNDQKTPQNQEAWHVLPDNVGGGPHGLGDPDDTSLRKVELEVMIPKIMKYRAHKEKCTEYVKEFEECGKENGLLLPLFCRKQVKVMRNCLTQWYQTEDFKNECKEIYLKERAEYRRTGIRKKMRKM